MPLRVRQELLIMKIKIEEQTLEGHALNHYRIERMKQCQTLNAVAKEAMDAGYTVDQFGNELQLSAFGRNVVKLTLEPNDSHS